jgi:hypothetical protein
VPMVGWKRAPLLAVASLFGFLISIPYLFSRTEMSGLMSMSMNKICIV